MTLNSVASCRRVRRVGLACEGSCRLMNSGSNWFINICVLGERDSTDKVQQSQFVVIQIF